MKVFISWSESLSHQVAVVLRDWLPSVLQTVEPYVSSEDIDKGARWSSDISRELSESDFGILCVTRDNIDAPWLNFEAGALSKAFDKGRVAPFLFGLQRAEVPPGPLLQFQSTLYERDEISKLVHSINDACEDQGLESTRVDEALEVWWPRLNERLEPLLEQSQQLGGRPSDSSTKRGSGDVLVEILDLVRAQQRLLTTPEELLPAPYIAAIVGRGDASRNVERGALRALEYEWRRLVDRVTEAHSGLAREELLDLLSHVEDPLLYVLRRLGRRPPRRVRAIDLRLPDEPGTGHLEDSTG